MADSGLEGKVGNQGIRKWEADLDTDLMELCLKEGIPTEYSRRGRDRILYRLGYLLKRLYEGNGLSRKFINIRELVSIPKMEFMTYLDDNVSRYYRKEDREEYWKLVNKILRRHGFRMYMKGRNYSC